MTTRRNVITFALTAPLLAATGCGMRNSTTVRPFSSHITDSLNAYGWSATDEVGKARQAYAAAQLRDVRITYDQAAFDPQKFTTQLASGNVPDVVVMERQDVGTYAAKGLIRPLDEGFRLNGVDPHAHYYASTLQDVTYRGKIYGVPEFYQPFAILVNRKVSEAAGVSLADLDTSQPDRFLAAVRKMYRARHGSPQTLGFDPQISGTLPYWLVAFGGRQTDASGRPDLDNPANIKAVEFLKEIFEAQGGYPSATSYSQSFDMFGNDNQFMKNQVGAGVYAQWYPNVLASTSKGLKIAGVPMRDHTGAPLGVSSGSAFVIPATARNPSTACRWSIAMTSDAAWLAAAAARMKTVHSTPGDLFTGLFTASSTGDAAIRRRYGSTTGNPDFDQVIATYYEVLDHSRSVGASAAGDAVVDELNNAVVMALTNKKSVEAAMRDGQKAALYGYDQS
jgi:multiple sugar transport system substrate-binding protein